ncbi:hypothetical protein [Macrococcus lamae]|uniref:Uncharacterized protein n=1 Tax=Macrococcus lamae TaxID=198484 RepID=A0A4R6BTQ8_9STAP|nr:hypothetical protein [Macrococcus lamae]TDM10460.1 hypothetical protein ERX29_07255 [Macrococcus lamae]
MDNKYTLKDIKKEWNIDVDTNITNISQVIRDSYESYVKDPAEYNGSDINFEELQRSCEGLQPQLIPYSILTEIIFRNDMSENNLKIKEIRETTYAEILQSNYEKFLNDKYSLNSDSKNIDPFQNNNFIEKELVEQDKEKIIIVYKMIEHIKLAISQKEGLYEKQSIAISRLNSDIDENQKKVKKFEDSIKKLSDIEKSIESVYPQFVAILGIFTSIIFAVFGGFNQISAVGKNLQDTEITKLLIFLPMVMLGIIFLVFISFNAISKLTNLPLSSCKCEDKKNCDCQFHEKHPSIFYSGILFFYIMCIGALLRIYSIKDPKITLSSMFNEINGDDAIPTILLSVLIILAIIMLTRYLLNGRVEKPKDTIATKDIVIVARKDLYTFTIINISISILFFLIVLMIIRR